jgi:predicted Fe-S protein YdhL (DUF1289 family)
VIPSPCTKLCRLLDGTDECAGCHRTLREIGAWTALSDEEQLAVIAATRERRARAARN